MIMLPPETERLARLVAARRGKTPEDVLKEAVEIQLASSGSQLLRPSSLAGRST